LAQGPAPIRPELASAGARSRALAPSPALSAFDARTAAEHFDSAAPLRTLGGPDQNGFWNWQPAAVAMNERRWEQAKAELLAAEAGATEAAERAFAASALSLLAAPGQPLAGSLDALAPTGDLRVLSAGRWQLQVDNRLARFSQGVSARLPGFRAEGDALLLDLTFDRGSFAAGTRFTRVSDAAPARVLDAAAQPVSATDFIAPAGAVYNVQDRELRLR
jgi:hypothetical protein